MNNQFKKDLQELVTKYPEMKLKDIQEMLQESKKSLPKTWEEAYTEYLCNTTIYYIDINSEIHEFTKPDISKISNNKNALLSSERAEEVLALIQLITLRDIYNNGWKPDYTNFQEDKHTIVNENNDIVIKVYNLYPRMLAFKTSGLAYEFIENFKDLIEKAKELI
jgi:hypothetical protein